MDDQSKWLEDPSFPVFAEGDVHVWRIQLDALKASAEGSVLSADERQRARAFHFEKDRNEFSRTREMLRRLLGRYLGVLPQGINIAREPDGKPFVCSEKDLRFNVSHSHGIALIAFAQRINAGVDVEFQREDLDVAELAERFFAEPEKEAVRQAKGAEKAAVFYRIWSAKEACVKAVGGGLQIPLDRFSVASVLAEDGSPVEVPLREGSRFLRLHRVPDLDGFSAALALESKRRLKPKFFTWVS